MKLRIFIVVTFINRISKFGYDQINFYDRKALLKNGSNPSKVGSHKQKNSKIKCCCFHPKW